MKTNWTQEEHELAIEWASKNSRKILLFAMIFSFIMGVLYGSFYL